jgi:thiol-disulfide isomerase/thioredoxin
MKRLLLTPFLCLLLFIANAQVNFDALTFNNSFPQRLQTLSFQFNQKLSPLISEKKIDIIVYQFTKNGLIVKEPVVMQKANMYSATITIDSNATCLAFDVSAGKNRDNNAGKGYIVPIYDANKAPVKDYYVMAGQLYNGYGEFLFGMSNNPQKNLDLLEEGLAKHPELNDDARFANSYNEAILAVKKADGKKIIADKMAALEAKPNLTENDYGQLVNYFAKNKNKPKSDSLKKILVEKYPDGMVAFTDKVNKIYFEKEASKKVAIFNDYNNLPADKKNDNTLNMMRSQIASAYENEKNNEEAEKWRNTLPKGQKASLLNNKSWAMAEKGEDLQLAKKMSAEATFYAKAQMEKPTEKKPDNISTKQFKQNNEQAYAMYADTYAFILYQLGEYKEGLPYAKFGAMYNKLNDAEYNERYAMLLEKAAPLKEAKGIVEQIVVKGKASEKSREALKNLYKKEKKSDAGFDAYLAKLELKAKQEKKAELVKSMMNKPSPKFALKDFDGKEVSLESLKGKIVIVDFWATWCGPCIASMPGMKKAQEKLATRDDVKFLFVDTWENVDDKLANAKDFMSKKNYPFYVLMDNDNKMVSDFEVSGIPTKYVLDKNGNIRFKAIGFSGSADDLVDEISEMVALVSN